MVELSNARLTLLLSGFLLALAFFGSLDLILDGFHSWNSLHGVAEIMIILISFILSLFLWYGWIMAKRSLVKARRNLMDQKKEQDMWRQKAQKYLKGLGEVIAEQLKTWGLTAAESETAFFLLKGLSYKEMAKYTGKSERTVRQHGISIFRKSGLSGRAEFSAFFLEDLLLPANATA